MDKYNAVCFDLDGTVYRGNEVIPEAVTLIEKLQRGGIEPYFVTNNSSSTTQQFQTKLLRMGIQTKPEQIMTSAIASAKYCKEHYDGASIMMIGEEGLEEALVSEGFQLTTQNPDVVVVGIDRSITYEKLAAASLAIRAGAHFIATNGDRAFPTEKGLVPGNGSFVKLLETTTDCKATYVGKPEPHMLHFIQQKGYRKDEMIMIGDNYETDIQAGIRFGIDTIHVEGGVTSAETVRKQPSLPTYFYKSLADWK
ncbi:TIGR01457 family HAD-type hydrolase [Sporosarcina sp. ACRSL]|uniref:TIGR01457 family HAD-type hydrolase n=1 Tax=Sporosarcina sp. ACRSL TaxID=2918215 RepID=UPI001EF455B2|nr:TIGR01457 family HAD-type hydrolase [Sporosarcina sp. ACRSL]MCG7346514.1 TIGR01457 family HAD-type hydrolase [Sporosarcina sp. ACRSL]